MRRLEVTGNECEIRCTWNELVRDRRCSCIEAESETEKVRDRHTKIYSQNIHNSVFYSNHMRYNFHTEVDS